MGLNCCKPRRELPALELEQSVHVSLSAEDDLSRRPVESKILSRRPLESKFLCLSAEDDLSRRRMRSNLGLSDEDDLFEPPLPPLRAKPPLLYINVPSSPHTKRSPPFRRTRRTRRFPPFRPFRRTRPTKRAKPTKPEPSLESVPLSWLRPLEPFSILQTEESKEEVTKRQDDGSTSTSIKHGHVSSEDWDLKDMYDACQSGDKERFFRIHEKVPALFTENNGPCLLRITESGNRDFYIAVESLLREGKGEEERQQNIANFIDADKESMLHKACRSGNRDMYEYLCDTYPSLIASIDKSSLLQLTCELNKADIMSLVLPSVEDENEIDRCLTQYQLDDRCKQAVASELKQRIADKFNSDSSYRIEPTLNDVGEVVFLAYGLSVVWERVEQFAGIKVLFRNPKQVDDEAIRIANSDEMRTLNTNNIQGMEFAERAIQLKGTGLMEAHSNINALGVSHLRSRKGGKVLKTAGTILVVIYCNSKGFRPIQEDIFPHQLLVDDVVVLTDVREGFFEIAPRAYLAIPSSHFHSKLKMGCECEVGDNEKRRGGTIGPFVKIHSKKDCDLNGFLTCAHVAYGLNDRENSYSYDEINKPDQLQVNQPAVVDFPMPQKIIPYDPKCGKTYRGTFGVTVDGVTVDAAVVAVQKDRMPSGGEFAILRPNQLREIGFKTFPVFDSAEQADATQIMNEEIVKFGAMTHATKGVYVSLIHVREPILMGIVGPTGLKERRFEMKGQLEISSCTANERFFALGDSGSGVFVKRGDDLRCLGLGIGCLSNGSAVVTPIKPILKALRVDLMKFTEPMDETQTEESKEEVTTRQDEGSDSTSIKHGQVSSEDLDLKDMYDACQSGDKERFFRIHEKIPALFTENNGPCLLRISESGNRDFYIAVESLLREGKGEEERHQYIATFIDANKETMLHKACRSGNRDMYEYLSDTYPSLIASIDKFSLLQLTCELNKVDIMILVLPSVQDENEIGRCLTQYQLDDRCKQAVALELKQRIADKFNSDSSYRIEATLNDVGVVVFLAYGLSVVRERVEQFAGIKVLFRNPKQANDEAIRIANSDEMRTLKTNNIQGMEYAEKAIQLKGTSLMEAHSNINALGVSHLRSRKGGKVLEAAENILLVIYCSSKGFRPIQEDIFPHQLLVDDVVVLTDVREGFFEIAPRDYSAIPSSYFHFKLKMGCECDVQDDGESICGTIGPFVKIHSKQDGDLDGFLTCAHVAYGVKNGKKKYQYDEINNSTQLQVNQPPVDNFSNPPPNIPYDPKCGKTYRGTFGKIVDGVTVDAAVVVVEKDRMPSGGEFAILRPNQLREIGFKTFPVFDSAEQADATQIMNEEIVKFGAMTHATKGVYVLPIYVREPMLMGIVGPTGLIERRFEMKGQLEISSCTANERFFALGDSGSGVFVKRGDDLRCLGLGIGCLSNGSAVVTPIKPILKALGVKLMKFTEPMDESQ